jgi:hypothetical protein
VLADDRSLEALIRAKSAATRRENASRRTAMALKALSPPDAPRETAPLEAVAVALRRAESRLTRARLAMASLSDLSEPPALSDLAPLHDLSRRTARASAAAARLARQLADLDRQLADARGEADAWAHEHPACPTCGGPIDADRLLTPAHRACDAKGGADDGDE